MKKILIALLCTIIIISAMTVAAFAEEEIPSSVDTNTSETETLPTETESIVEGENTPTEELPTDAPVDIPVETPTDAETPAETPWITTEQIVEWIYANYDSITVILTVVGTLLLIVYRLSMVIKSITTCNNNAVAVAENSNLTIQEALAKIESVASVVDEYKSEICNLLAEIRQSDAEKKMLTKALAEHETYLKTAKFANMELANEMAELLVLANIPNSKKDELYARHRAAVDALDAIELTANHTEVKENDGEET